MFMGQVNNHCDTTQKSKKSIRLCAYENNTYYIIRSGWITGPAPVGYYSLKTFDRPHKSIHPMSDCRAFTARGSLCADL